MKFERSSGILLHPTSLPGACGSGDLGPQAFRWLDWLAGSGCHLWQVLPLGPTGYGDSPYQGFSAFAGNPLLISPELLVQDGLLDETDLQEASSLPLERVDYAAVIPWKTSLLERVYQRHTAAPGRLRGEFEQFCSLHASWLDDYALFMALKEVYGGGPWEGWPEPLRTRRAPALAEARRTLQEGISRISFVQFLFFRQWNSLHETARKLGVHIIGDLPIYVAYDSADVWAHPELFFLDDNRHPTVVAGVPPDYFSPTGQLWGNPLYRWEVHIQTGYQWWLERLRAALSCLDIIRLDHFRGFGGYWEVPASEATAVRGRWVPGPGEGFFSAVLSALGDLPIIAEDLGEITPDVVALRDQFALPGMKILQFAFSGPDNPFLPHHYSSHCVVYTGTHDNDTARGWYESAPEGEREFARRYLGQVQGRPKKGDFSWQLIRLAWSSVAAFALAPLQDFLNLDSQARMNYPSRLGGNWSWRMPAAALSAGLQEKILELNRIYSR